VVEAAVRIENELGLHARPAALFVKQANRYRSEIFVCKDDMEVNGKSIMSVMMLAVESGTEIRIRAVGEDAEAAVKALVELVRSGFGE
jgi:phosphocarrier protein